MQIMKPDFHRNFRSRPWGRLALLFFFLAADHPAAAAPLQIEAAATLPRTQQFRFQSEAVGREYLIQVAEPVRPVRPGEKVAAVYVLDGDYTFGLATDAARALQIMREMAPAYVIAISYPGGDHNGWVRNRLFDLLHFRSKGLDPNVGGGGHAFERFLLDELRPAIESHYPIDSARTVLAGHSLGGLFATNLLLNRADAFSGYVIGSPSLWIEPEILERAQQAAERARAPGARVFVGAGEEEKEKDLALMAERLAGIFESSERFPVRHRTFAGEGHVSVAGSLLSNGLRFLLPPQ